MENFENYCFVSVVQRVWVLHVFFVFVYNAVDINKIIAVLLAKLPLYISALRIAYLIIQLLVNILSQILSL